MYIYWVDGIEPYLERSSLDPCLKFQLLELMARPNIL
jgi:hypothetical protein